MQNTSPRLVRLQESRARKEEPEPKIGGPESKGHPFTIGANYFIRTVTHHHTGRLVLVTKTELVLESAAWIADDGRLGEALRTGNFQEVEMFPPGRRVIIGRGSLIDATEIGTLPTVTK